MLLIFAVMLKGKAMFSTILEIFLLVLCVACFLLLLFLLIEYSDWSSGVSDTAPKLTFDAFKKLYVLNPSKWEFFSNYVVYYPNGDIETEGKSIVIEFKHFVDVIRYEIFQDKLRVNEEELERIRREKEFLEYIQNDIDTYREENLAEIKKILQL